MHYEEKELDTFPTTYMKDYKWFKNAVKSKINFPLDTFALPEEEKHNFIRQIKFRIGPEDLDAIKKLYTNRMQTVYKVSYCKERENEPDDDEEATTTHDKDTMMTEAKKLYSDRNKQKVLAPVPTSRRIFGYCRPAFYHTELSEYQGTYGYLAYNTLKEYESKGVSRLAPKFTCEKKPGGRRH